MLPRAVYIARLREQPLFDQETCARHIMLMPARFDARSVAPARRAFVAARRYAVSLTLLMMFLFSRRVCRDAILFSMLFQLCDILMSSFRRHYFLD